MTKKLWTKNFTIITLGTVMSMFGASVNSFAVSLLILDMTSNMFLYSLYLTSSVLPNLIVPLIVGPFLDRFPRKNIIVILDFMAGAYCFTLAALIYFNISNYLLFLCLGICFGCITSFYTVAYDSFYPELITEGYYSKAYSVSSLIYPLATTVMVPVAAFCYKTVGLLPLFAFNGVAYIIAALFESSIRVVEKHTINKQNSQDKKYGFAKFKVDFVEGIRYVNKEKGLKSVIAYFFVCMMAGSVSSTLILPFFKNNPLLGVDNYSIITILSTIGRLCGGMLHYKFRIKPNRKFMIALIVYFCISVADIAFYFSPLYIMFGIQFFSGLFSVTSYNIRISGTQNYLTDEKRGRFNGLFLMITTVGTLLGQLIAGVFGGIYETKYIMVVVMGVNILAIILTMVRNRSEVKKIYNKDI